jgi:hypothetical protein
MRTLISLLVVLSLSIIALPRLHAAGLSAAVGPAPAPSHRVQARKKKAKKSRPPKAKSAAKKTDKPKKNDPGFAL